MNLITAVGAFFLALILILVGVTRVGVWVIERRHPPIGQFLTIDDTRMHFVHLKPDGPVDLPPVVFIHGASSNLKDQLIPVRAALEGRAELLFLDRPGHGWSSRGPGNNETPFGQGDRIAGLMRKLGIRDAIIVGHSFGGAVTAAFALNHPDLVSGLVFLSPASHPWPGAGTSWYNDLTIKPVVGPLFSETLALPGALASIGSASACVFSPNALSQTYLRDVGISLLLRPATFRANATDVAGLYAHTLAASPRYREIEAPTVVVTGDHDTVVYSEIHAGGLIRDLPNARGVWVHNLGHKPDWVAPELTVGAIKWLAGETVDLDAIVSEVESRIAGDDHATDFCSVARPDDAAGE